MCSPRPLTRTASTLQVLDLLRKSGTRMINVQKNIGADGRYAFNILQVRTLPRLLRPPEGTYGSSTT